MNYCIFKIQTDIQDSKQWNSIKFSKTEGIEFNPSFIDVTNVYRCIYGKRETEKIVSFENFIEWINRHDKKIDRYVGWSCLSFDIPVLLYQCIKHNIEINSKLFTLNRYSTKPIFDIQECLYNWNRKNSLILTAVDLGLSYNKILEQEYEKVKNKNIFLLEKGKLIYDLFDKTKNYFL